MEFHACGEKRLQAVEENDSLPTLDNMVIEMITVPVEAEKPLQ